MSLYRITDLLSLGNAAHVQNVGDFFLVHAPCGKADTHIVKHAHLTGDLLTGMVGGGIDDDLITVEAAHAHGLGGMIIERVKAALFEDLVGEAAKGLLEQFKAAQTAHFDLVSKEKTKDSLKLSNEYLRVFVEYMYAHFDAFKLILCRAEGTRYANFLEELVELEVECSEEYYALLRKGGKLSGKMTKQLHHMITSAYFTAVCETIAHDMPKEEAMRYIEELAKFFNSGWKGLLRLE